MPDKENSKLCCSEGLVVIAEPIPCCNQTPAGTYWSVGTIDTPSGKVMQIGTKLEFRDTLGAWKARWAINRMRYTISPGLYAVGDPDNTSPVLVTANYKMSFDRLRKELEGVDAWVMVLDTKGINVWCAAGKGTFGTEELIRRIAIVGLSRVVSHNTIILPQLGAPGVAAHEVRKQSGFDVVYGPVRAADIKVFLKSNMKAAKGMRSVKFGFMDRLVLTPVELVNLLKPIAIIAAALVIVAITGLITVSFYGLYPFVGAILIGAVVGPALLPWIPGRALSWKGWLMGFLWTMLVLCLHGNPLLPGMITNKLALIFLLPAISSFLTLNFTGATTYTSLSGVKKEMRSAIPVIIILALAGIGFWLGGRI